MPFSLLVDWQFLHIAEVLVKAFVWSAFKGIFEVFLRVFFVFIRKKSHLLVFC